MAAPVYILLSFAFTRMTVAQEYPEYFVGSLISYAHDINGDVYLADSDKIRLRNFIYDGQAPDAVFWIGVRDGAAGNSPDSSGETVPDENDSEEALGAYDNADIVLTLPRGLYVSDILWFSVWCRQFAADFGSLRIPTEYNGKLVGQLSSLAHSVSSGDVWILDRRRFKIEHLNYDGFGPDAYFLVGTSGQPDEDGRKVPDEDGSLLKLHGYDDATIVITLPEDVDLDSLTWLSMYCIRATQNFGDVRLHGPHNNIPPYIPTRVDGPEPQAGNCETMDENNFNVAWEIVEENIIFEYEGNIDPSKGYMAFGISGSDSASVMGGGDVIVVYREDDVTKVKDYTINAYSLCSSGAGVCPDEDAGGSDDIVMLSASLEDGVTKVRFQRPLAATNVDQDTTIPVSGSAYVIWATGDVNPEGMVTKHVQRLSGNKQIDFGRPAENNCERVETDGGDKEQSNPWTIPAIPGENTNTFVAKIGPAGGKRGYEGITGTISWGIAWYINDLLIPELVLKRGETFTFKVEGGNDDSNLARYHPLYITDDPVGGYRAKTEEQKESVRLLAGTMTTAIVTSATDGRYCEYIPDATNPDTFNTFDDYFLSLNLSCDAGDAGDFTWTPDETTPDLVYYQCFTHNYLGWQIHVVNEYSEYDDTPEYDGGSWTIAHNSLARIAIFTLFSVLFST